MMKVMCIASVLLLGGSLSLASESYEPTWKSLAQHKAAPEWLKDAKFGIYFHWGAYSVPAFGNEWYPRWMHFDGFLKDQSQNPYKIGRHHVTTYGSPRQAAYHDFIPEFTGEYFDADEWVELFQRTGAKFAGPVAEHHDGFSMWASKVTPWNAVEMGPKRDVLGEMFQALEKRGMKRIATFHHARNLQRYADKWEGELDKDRAAFRNSHFPYMPGLPPTSTDPKLRMLYGNMPEDEWCENLWLGKLKEVVDTYQPDIVWFDSWLDEVPESYRQRFCAYYLNAAETWDRGDVAIIRKQEDLPIDFTINDHEKSREPNVLPELWMTDDTVSTFSWSYTEGMGLKTLDMLLHGLIDAVSKNGVVLLNISPKADGTIPLNQRALLMGLGDWLRINGEAIYSTRPWTTAAEGPTAEPAGGFADHAKFLDLEYSAADIRYTVSKDGKAVYAMTLGRPADGESILLESLSKGKVDSVELLSGEQLEWKQTGKGLRITPRNSPASTVALAFKITLK